MQIRMAGVSKIRMNEVETLSVDELLGLRFCDFDWTAPLPPAYQRRVNQVLRECASRELALAPTIYAAKEWVSPEGRSAVGVPFYLMHPKFTALEVAFKREAEGATELDFLKLMRHEMGHCFDHAFGLSRRRDFAQIFGSPRKTYNPEFYLPDTHSKEHVEHLPGYYAQAHPLEDFAETFAVWLDPTSQWSRRYAKRPIALGKLRFVDALAKQFAGQTPRHTLPLMSEAKKSVMPLSLHYKRQSAQMAKFCSHVTMNK